MKQQADDIASCKREILRREHRDQCRNVALRRELNDRILSGGGVRDLLYRLFGPAPSVVPKLVSGATTTDAVLSGAQDSDYGSTSSPPTITKASEIIRTYKFEGSPDPFEFDEIEKDDDMVEISAQFDQLRRDDAFVPRPTRLTAKVARDGEGAWNDVAEKFSFRDVDRYGNRSPESSLARSHPLLLHNMYRKGDKGDTLVRRLPVGLNGSKGYTLLMYTGETKDTDDGPVPHGKGRFTKDFTNAPTDEFSMAVRMHAIPWERNGVFRGRLLDIYEGEFCDGIVVGKGVRVVTLKNQILMQQEGYVYADPPATGTYEHYVWYTTSKQPTGTAVPETLIYSCTAHLEGPSRTGRGTIFLDVRYGKVQSDLYSFYATGEEKRVDEKASETIRKYKYEGEVRWVDAFSVLPAGQGKDVFVSENIKTFWNAPYERGRYGTLAVGSVYEGGFHGLEHHGQGVQTLWINDKALDVAVLGETTVLGTDTKLASMMEVPKWKKILTRSGGWRINRQHGHGELIVWEVCSLNSGAHGGARVHKRHIYRPMVHRYDGGWRDGRMCGQGTYTVHHAVTKQMYIDVAATFYPILENPVDNETTQTAVEQQQGKTWGPSHHGWKGDSDPYTSNDFLNVYWEDIGWYSESGFFHVNSGEGERELHGHFPWPDGFSPYEGVEEKQMRNPFVTGSMPDKRYDFPFGYSEDQVGGNVMGHLKSRVGMVFHDYEVFGVETLNSKYGHGALMDSSILVGFGDVAAPFTGTVTFGSGDVYEGESRFAGGDILPSAGKMTYANGDVFEGTYIYKFGDADLEGAGTPAWATGIPHESRWTRWTGHGTYTYTAQDADVDSRYSALFGAHGFGTSEFRKHFNKGREYDPGLSTMVHETLIGVEALVEISPGDTFEGTWTNGDMHGVARYHDDDGNVVAVYDGEFKQSRMAFIGPDVYQYCIEPWLESVHPGGKLSPVHPYNLKCGSQPKNPVWRPRKWFRTPTWVRVHPHDLKRHFALYGDRITGIVQEIWDAALAPQPLLDDQEGDDPVDGQPPVASKRFYMVTADMKVGQTIQGYLDGARRHETYGHEPVDGTWHATTATSDTTGEHVSVADASGISVGDALLCTIGTHTHHMLPGIRVCGTQCYEENVTIDVPVTVTAIDGTTVTLGSEDHRFTGVEIARGTRLMFRPVHTVTVGAVSDVVELHCTGRAGERTIVIHYETDNVNENTEGETIPREDNHEDRTVFPRAAARRIVPGMDVVRRSVPDTDAIIDSLNDPRTYLGSEVKKTENTKSYSNLLSNANDIRNVRKAWFAKYENFQEIGYHPSLPSETTRVVDKTDDVLTLSHALVDDLNGPIAFRTVGYVYQEAHESTISDDDSQPHMSFCTTVNRPRSQEEVVYAGIDLRMRQLRVGKERWVELPEYFLTGGLAGRTEGLLQRAIRAATMLKFQTRYGTDDERLLKWQEGGVLNTGWTPDYVDWTLPAGYRWGEFSSTFFPDGREPWEIEKIRQNHQDTEKYDNYIYTFHEALQPPLPNDNALLWSFGVPRVRRGHGTMTIMKDNTRTSAEKNVSTYVGEWDASRPHNYGTWTNWRKSSDDEGWKADAVYEGTWEARGNNDNNFYLKYGRMHYRQLLSEDSSEIRMLEGEHVDHLETADEIYTLNPNPYTVLTYLQDKDRAKYVGQVGNLLGFDGDGTILPEGHGTMHYRDGRTAQGRWEAGELVSEGDLPDEAEDERAIRRYTNLPTPSIDLDAMQFPETAHVVD